MHRILLPAILLGVCSELSHAATIELPDITFTTIEHSSGAGGVQDSRTERVGQPYGPNAGAQVSVQAGDEVVQRFKAPEGSSFVYRNPSSAGTTNFRIEASWDNLINGGSARFEPVGIQFLTPSGGSLPLPTTTALGSMGDRNLMYLVDLQPGLSFSFDEIELTYTWTGSPYATTYERGSFILRSTHFFSPGSSGETGLVTLDLLPDGASEYNPLLPANMVPDPETGYTFNGQTGDGAWFDPIPADGFRYGTTDGSKFTKVILPGSIGDVDGEFTIVDAINGNVILAAETEYEFPVPVGEFEVRGIDPEVDAENPDAFPTYLEFDRSTVNFTMRPIPEPSAAALLTLASVALLRRRRG